MKLKINLQPVITPNLFTMIFIFMGVFCVWHGFYFFYQQPEPMQGFIGSIAETILPSNSLAAHFISFILMILCALFLAQVNNKHAFINTHTFLPTLIFIVLSTCWLPSHGHYLSYLAALILLIGISILLKMYRNPAATEAAFLGFFFLAISSAFIPEYFFLIPFFWFGFFALKGFSIRTFFASITGFVTPWILLYAVVFIIHGNVYLLPDAFSSIGRYSLYDNNNIPTIAYLIFLSVILILTIAGVAKKMNFENIKVRSQLLFFHYAGFGLILIFIFRFSNFVSYLPLLAVFYSITSAYTFTFHRNLFYSVLFMMLILGSFIFSLYLSLFISV